MKKIIKITVDIIMTLLFFVLMAYHFTCDAVHEYLGFLLFIFFILPFYIFYTSSYTQF